MKPTHPIPLPFLILTTLTTLTNAACTDAADGFASLNGGTTGGAAGDTVTITTQAELAQYAGAEEPYIIKIPGRIEIDPRGTEIKVSSDKTIIGAGGEGEIFGGGFFLEGVRNVIIRNLRVGNTYVEDDPDGKMQDWDGVQMDTASNVWIDHCIFEKGGDGLIDSRKDTTYLTVSNTILRDHNKVFGIGWTDNVSAEVTIHHNHFQNVNQRNPSTDNALHAHLYNNYLENVNSYGHYARGGTSMKMENVFFQSTNNPITKDDTASLDASGNVYEDCTGTIAENGGEVFDPREFYEYTVDAVEDVPAIVTAGAGPRAEVCE
ncbi:hypothetical protein FQN52_000718 [Onygenales sp. PD_12]|nr:hypothetical protein FQN52_000718 [Onygenales sp. PD_12]